MPKRKKRSKEDTKEEAQGTEPLRSSARTILGIPMRAHEASWRMGGAPRFFEECFEMGIDVDSFKKLDDLYAEFVRMENARRNPNSTDNARH